MWLVSMAADGDDPVPASTQQDMLAYFNDIGVLASVSISEGAFSVSLTVEASSASGALPAALAHLNRAGALAGLPRWLLSDITVTRGT